MSHIPAPGSPQEQNLDFLREHMISIANYADAGASFSDARDTAGLSYCVQKMIIHLKATAATTRELLTAEAEARERL